MGGGGGSKKILVGFVVLMFLGSVVYFRLWTIDYKVSSDETELIRFAMFPILSLSTSIFIINGLCFCGFYERMNALYK